MQVPKTTDKAPDKKAESRVIKRLQTKLAGNGPYQGSSKYTALVFNQIPRFLLINNNFLYQSRKYDYCEYVFTLGRPGSVKVEILRGQLGNPNQGGGAEDLRVVADWATFVSRHAETFSYDAATKCLSLRSHPQPGLVPVPRVVMVCTPFGMLLNHQSSFHELVHSKKCKSFCAGMQKPK